MRTLWKTLSYSAVLRLPRATVGGMLNRIWHLIGVSALVAGGVLAISRGPDGDAYSVVAFLVVVVGVVALTRANPEACGRNESRPSKLGSRFQRRRRADTTAG